LLPIVMLLLGPGLFGLFVATRRHA
jgi:hypothetical protein